MPSILPFRAPALIRAPRNAPCGASLQQVPACLPHAAVTMVAVACAVAMTGCASVYQPDPLEGVNRKVSSFNEGDDRVVLKPVATAYAKVVPPVAQTGVRNFFSNLKNPWTSANLVLQGKPGEGLTTMARFGTNTTVGAFGLMDVATGWGMPARTEDFGLTLDTWGVGTGPYVVLPIFGPSNVRDALSSPVDSLGNPLGQLSSVSTKNTLAVVDGVSQRARHLNSSQLIDEVALDKYVFMRDAHLKRRNRSVPSDDGGRLQLEGSGSEQQSIPVGQGSR